MAGNRGSAVEDPHQPARPAPGRETRPALAAARTGERKAGLAGASDWLERHALLVTVVSIAAILCMAGAPAHLVQDAYLALVAGRFVAEHGIPHHDTLTVVSHGVRWIDQQWLAQLALYEVQHTGGYALYVLVDSALVILGLGLAIAAALKLGANDRQMIGPLVFGALLFLILAVTIRTQAFAYPLFAGVLWLLAAEVRAPTRRRVYLVFPLLLLWANLHGSVTIGAGLAVLYGLCVLSAEVRSRGARGLMSPRGLLFVAGPVICALITPYGFSIFHYYDATLFNSGFGKLVPEWRPVTSELALGIPFLLLVAWAGWLMWRGRQRAPAFDWLAMAALAVGGIVAFRNIPWFGLAMVILLPAAIARSGRQAEPLPSRRRLNLAIAWAVLGITAITVVATLAHPASWFQSTYDHRAVAVVREQLARDPSAKIFADFKFGDWLLWNDPGLAGRVAYDTRFELVPARDLKAFAGLYNGHIRGNLWAIASYSVLVLDPKANKESRALLARPGVRVLLRSRNVIVATKPAT